MAEILPENIGGCVLAGGLSTRMGEQEKSLMDLNGKPLVYHVINRFKPMVSSLIINANGDPSRFDKFRLQVIADTVEGFAGPLAGILAAMAWYRKNQPEISHVLAVAGDSPYFPIDLRDRLLCSASESNSLVALAFFKGQRHPTFGLWSVDLHDSLYEFLVDEGNRKIMLFVERKGYARYDFSDGWQEDYDPFFNVNTPEELCEAQAIYEVVHGS